MTTIPDDHYWGEDDSHVQKDPEASHWPRYVVSIHTKCFLHGVFAAMTQIHHENNDENDESKRVDDVHSVLFSGVIHRPEPTLLYYRAPRVSGVSALGVTARSALAVLQRQATQVEHQDRGELPEDWGQTACHPPIPFEYSFFDITIIGHRVPGRAQVSGRVGLLV